MTNNEFYEFFRDHTERNYCKGTYVARTSQIKCHFLPLYGEMEVRAITPVHINDDYDNMEAEGLAHNTIFGQASALMSYFRYAEDCEEVIHNPMDGARKIRPENKDRE